MLQTGELDGKAIFQVAHYASWILPRVTSEPIGGR
jgi:hypothetical protein